MSTRGPAEDDEATTPALEQTSDDTALGWGDESADQADADRDAWYLAERPPHHEG